MPPRWTDAPVAALRRYPVKSLLGEAVDALDLDARGCAGDRDWSVRTADGHIASGKDTRRFAAVPGLLDLRAYAGDGGVTLVLPDGSALPVQEAAGAVSAHVGQPVTLARETDVSHFDDGPVSLLGTASVDAVSAELGEDVDWARFRPNVLLRTERAFAEDDLVGRRLRIGGAVVEVTMASPRCVMVDLESADLPRGGGVLRAVGRVNGACLGVVARVVTPGRVRLGDRALTLSVEAGP